MYKNDEEAMALLRYWAKQLHVACETHASNLGSPLGVSDRSGRIIEIIAQRVNNLVNAVVSPLMAIKLTIPERVESIARKVCEEAGHDPDTEVSHFSPFRIVTPMGEVFAIEKNRQPLWHFYACVAKRALDEIEKAQ